MIDNGGWFGGMAAGLVVGQKRSNAFAVQAMAEHGIRHISSAVVATLPDHTGSVLVALHNMDGVDVYAHERGKIVVVIEGATTGVMGDALSKRSLMDGVVSPRR
ncbi:nitrate reductase NapAB chaperone NapD [Rhizobium tibeticum]|uniref:chaperone NapD n=1 Tax=Rhizobium tibeticum TaxID=501024 RepID=UPI00278159E9|nr:chaperone NapD [Rhizobium tibeticum]MDP9812578.1 nitrate reductase NapAB chaperone NapD [Rhizobium tibeticum]